MQIIFLHGCIKSHQFLCPKFQGKKLVKENFKILILSGTIIFNEMLDFTQIIIILQINIQYIYNIQIKIFLKIFFVMSLYNKKFTTF